MPSSSGGLKLRDPARLALLIAERRRREASRDDVPDIRQQLLGDISPQQRACIEDDSEQVAVLGTRRCGKTRTWLRYMLVYAKENPGSHQIYVNTTRGEIKRLAWRGANPKDGLDSLNRDLSLGGKPNKQDLTITFPGNTVIECIPADDERAISKMLGSAPSLVWIDEAQKMPHLQPAIESVLGPALMDFGGRLLMTGTPNRNAHGYYYEITKRAGGIENEPLIPAADGWSVHNFNVLDNPFFGETREARYAKTIEKEMRKRGWKGGEPELLREWYGRWVREDSMYAYDVHKVPEHELLFAPSRVPDRCDFSRELIDAALEDLPDHGEWCFGVSADLGYNPDPFAVVIWAWSLNSPVLYELLSWEKAGLIPDAQAEVLQVIADRLLLHYMVADAGGAGGVVKGWETGWKDRLPLPIEPAEKAQKETAREWLNNDIRSGYVKLRRGGRIHEQMRVLPLRTLPNGKIVEDQRRDTEGRRKYMNDCCDAALYGHRAAQHHRYVPKEQPPERGTEDWHNYQAEKWFDEAAEQDEEEMYGG